MPSAYSRASDVLETAQASSHILQRLERSSSDSLVKGSRWVRRISRSKKKQRVHWLARGEAASHTTVSDPSAGVRSRARITR